jgi:uncharacterized protein
MKKAICLFCMFLALAITVASQRPDVGEVPAVSVTGTAEVAVVPDRAMFRLRVIRSDKSVAKAKTLNEEGITKLVELARKYNIPNSEIKTDYISVKEKRDRIKQRGDSEFSEVFVGYTVSRTMLITQTDLKRFESLFSDLVQGNIGEISDVAFESSQLRRYKDQARSIAMKAAREKATAMAAEIGQSIGKAISIEEENIDGFRSPYANITTRDGTDGDDGDLIGTISVKAQVKVRFVLN